MHQSDRDRLDVLWESKMQAIHDDLTIEPTQPTELADEMLQLVSGGGGRASISVECIKID